MRAKYSNFQNYCVHTHTERERDTTTVFFTNKVCLLHKNHFEYSTHNVVFIYDGFVCGASMSVAAIADINGERGGGGGGGGGVIEYVNHIPPPMA